MTPILKHNDRENFLGPQGETDGRVIFWIMSMSIVNLLQENSNEGIFLSASKWEVSDNEARMGELLFHRCTKIG